MRHIYLDFNATTPIHPQVADAMQPYLREFYGNPSSAHWFGVQTRRAIERARSQVAHLLKCESDEIIFTSGGSESDNFAIAGYAQQNRGRGNHIIVSQVEHPAVLEICRRLETQGFEVSYLRVDEYGAVDAGEVARNIKPTTILISIMQANNEVGTIQPISEIVELAHARGIAVHTDAAQAVGKIAVEVPALGVDMLTLAGHKFYAPKGIGALFVRHGIELQPLILGAGHEQGRRAGTENVLEIVGLGAACELVGREMSERAPIMLAQRDLLQSLIQEELPQAKVNGHPQLRLPNTLSVSFPGIEANTIISELEHVACSPGAACHSDKVMMSHVLEAMKVPVEYAMGTIRLSVGYMTSEADIREAAEAIVTTIGRLQPQGATHTVATSGEEEVRLTKYTHGLGCACKLRPQELERVLAQLPRATDANVIIGTESSDDAAVYRLNDELAIVQTVDFFTPVVDDPYDFGAIAAANSLSDIYAMGGRPIFALSVVGFPSQRLPVAVLGRILQGAADKAREAGIDIIGGHTVDDTEPKFGLAISGLIHPDRILANNRARVGDALILTKPIGTGIISTAIKRGLATAESARRVTAIMSTLNRAAGESLAGFDVSACTDVTGFGLLGHLKEMVVGSGVTARITASRVPLIEAVRDYAMAGAIPGGSENNLDYVAPFVERLDSIAPVTRLILADAQTSGGLLIAVAPQQSESLLAKLKQNGVSEAAQIGEIVELSKGKIVVGN